MGGGRSRLWRRGGGIGGSHRGLAGDALFLVLCEALLLRGRRATIMGVETGNWNGMGTYFFWSVVGLPALGVGEKMGIGGVIIVFTVFYTSALVCIHFLFFLIFLTFEVSSFC